MLLFQTHLCCRALQKYCLTFLFIICCLTCQRVWLNHTLQSKGVFQQAWTQFLVSTFIKSSRSFPHTFFRATGAVCAHQCHFIYRAKQNPHSKGDKTQICRKKTVSPLHLCCSLLYPNIPNAIPKHFSMLEIPGSSNFSILLHMTLWPRPFAISIYAQPSGRFNASPSTTYFTAHSLTASPLNHLAGGQTS